MERVFAGGTKKAVFFDLNGTLYDPERTYLHSLNEVLAEFTGRWLPAGSAGAPGAAAPAASGAPHARVLAAYEAARREALRAAHARSTRTAQGAPLRLRCLAAALAGGGLPLGADRAQLAALDRRVRERGDARPLPAHGARAALEALAAARCRLAVLSNGSRDAALRRLRLLGLAEWLPEASVFAAQQPERRKPRPHLFRQALEACRVTPAEAVMVGDSWRADMIGAARCGIDGVWLCPHEKSLRRIAEGRYVRIIRRLEELAGMIL